MMKTTVVLKGKPLLLQLQQFHPLRRTNCCFFILHSLLSTHPPASTTRATAGRRPKIFPPPPVSISNPTTSTCCYSHLQVSAMSSSSDDFYTFGPYKIHSKEVFYSTDLSYAMVNLRPLLPETSDLWVTAQKVGSQLERFHGASSLTFAIQDGPQAGQTVPHVHIHIIPRKANDFEKNDEIYDAIDEKEKELKQKLDLDKERKDRSLEEMAQEAEGYRELFLQ
ncbi:unnamed protein product [Linum trigynum]|uniref:HIT domain-containing protein n=1 Tax=Linum trigynum TaxID=586398 RepID=A0AAV2GQ28_9ROSI